MSWSIWLSRSNSATSLLRRSTSSSARDFAARHRPGRGRIADASDSRLFARFRPCDKCPGQSVPWPDRGLLRAGYARFLGGPSPAHVPPWLSLPEDLPFRLDQILGSRPGVIPDCGRVLRRVGKSPAFNVPSRQIFEARGLACVGPSFRCVRLSALTDPNIRNSPGRVASRSRRRRIGSNRSPCRKIAVTTVRWPRATGTAGPGSIRARTGRPVAWARPKTWPCPKMSHSRRNFAAEYKQS